MIPPSFRHLSPSPLPLPPIYTVEMMYFCKYMTSRQYFKVYIKFLHMSCRHNKQTWARTLYGIVKAERDLTYVLSRLRCRSLKLCPLRSNSYALRIRLSLSCKALNFRLAIHFNTSITFYCLCWYNTCTRSFITAMI